MTNIRRGAGFLSPAKREVSMSRAFRCMVCGKVDVYKGGILVSPMCCFRPMAVERDMFVGGDPDRVNLDILRLRKPGVHAWMDEIPGDWKTTHFQIPQNWSPAYELWCFRPGRDKGERIGFFGRVERIVVSVLDAEAPFVWEFEMLPGIPEHLRRGRVPSATDENEQIVLGQEGDRQIVPLALVGHMWDAVNAS